MAAARRKAEVALQVTFDFFELFFDLIMTLFTCKLSWKSKQTSNGMTC